MQLNKIIFIQHILEYSNERAALFKHPVKIESVAQKVSFEITLLS